MPVPVEMEKPSFESFSPRKEEGVSKEYGGSGKRGPRRSFLQKAKRFGKQGRLGRGFQVDSETYSYFVRILELLKKDEFDTDEERELFVENSLSLTDGNEVQFSSNQTVSRVIETILPFAPEDVVMKVCQAFTPSLRVIVSDPYASHVLEKLLELTSSDKWRSSEQLVEWFEKTSLFVLNNFEDFTFETYSSFVMKKALECLCGFVEAPIEKEKHPLAVFKKSNLLINLYGIRKYNEKWENMLKDFAKRFMAWPQFNDLGQKPETARLLQNVVQTVHRTKDSQDIVKAFILRVLATLTPPLTPDNLAHRTLEVCLSVADNQMYKKIFNEFYKGHLIEYCTGTSYTLQKIVATAPDLKLFHVIFEELSTNIETLIKDGKAVIIHHLAEQCNKLNTKQTELYHLLQKGFKSIYGKTSNMLFSLMTLGSHNDNTENTDKFNTSYFGTCAVEQLMDFSNPSGAEIVNCLTEMDAAQLRTLALDRKASFVISKFFKSWKVPQKTKAQLLKKFKDALVELASTTFGSRIIDEIWLWADIPQKMEVAEVLSQRIPLLAANKFGRFMVENMGLNAYKRDKKEWVEHMTSVVKRKKDALDIAAELGLKTESKGLPTTPESDVKQEESKSAKKKNKKRKTEEEPMDQSFNDDLTQTPKKKKKNKKSAAEDSFHTADESQDTNTPKKKKKSKKSEGTAVNNDSFVSAVEALEEAETPKKKKKKNRKSEVESNINGSPSSKEPEMQPELSPSHKKKNKKSRKSEVESSINGSPSSKEAEMQPELSSSHEKKNKKRKSENTNTINDDNNEDLNVASPNIETPKKKKKKSRKSENVADADTTLEAEQGEDEEGHNETPKKKKKRKSEIVADTVDASQDDLETPKKQKKNRKSKQFE